MLGNDEGSIEITDTKAYYEGYSGEYTLNQTNSILTIELDVEGEIMEMEFGFDPNGLLLDAYSGEVGYVKNNATNVNYSLLDGMKFKQKNVNNILEFANGTVTSTVDGTNRYIVYNGKLWGYKDKGVDIIYEGNKIVSLKYSADTQLFEFNLIEE